MGQSKAENISVKYDSNVDVSGVDTGNLDHRNEIGFKFQAGFKYEFNQKIGVLSLFGYYDRTSEKELGKRIQLDMFDTSLQLQMHIWEGLYARVGINMPINGTLTLEMDDRTKEELQGELDTTGVIGYDAMLVYELMDHFNATFGFTMSNHDVKEERKTGGNEYTVKFDAMNYQLFVGMDYILYH